MQRIFNGFSIPSLMVFFLASSVFTPTAEAVVIERLEAAVNNSLILKSDLAKFRRTVALRAQLDPLFTGTAIATAGVKATDSDILEFLIDDHIIEQQFPMTDAEIEQEINSIQANNQITRDQLRQAIQSQGFLFPDYRELIGIGAAKRNLIDREIRTKVTVSDDDIRNYYYGVYAKGKVTPQAYRVLIITQKDRAKIEAALKDVRAGETFAKVAKEYSDDSTAESGGELGLLTEEQMNVGIRNELKKMKVGDTSSILGNAKSKFFFIHLSAVQAADDQRLKQVTEQIRGQLAAGEYQRQLQLWLERQRQLAFIRRAGDPPAAGLPKGL